MKHYIATIAILALLAAAHVAIQRGQAVAAAQNAPQDVLDIPTAFAAYAQQGEDYPVSDRVRELLQTSVILMRPYASAEGWPIVLTIVYAGTTRRSLHFPEVCLVGQGWEIVEQETEPIGFSFVAKRLILIKGNYRQAVLYWFKTGDELTGNFFVNSWHWTKNQLLSGSSTSAMIKLSSPIGKQDPEKVFTLLEDFALKFTPIMMEKIQ